MGSERIDAAHLSTCSQGDTDATAPGEATTYRAASRRRSDGPPHGPSDGQRRGDGSSSRDPVELVLYVNGDSPKMQSAVRTIEQAIARFAPDRVSLTICDLAKEPVAGAAERITITPALVRRSPAPRTFILGHITNPDVVAELLASWEDGAE